MIQWQIIFKAQYMGGYLVVVVTADTIEDAIKKAKGREIISITRICTD